MAPSTLLLAAALLARLASSTSNPSRYSGAAPRSQVVLEGCCARFTVLADAVVRIEWDADARFDDSQTVNVLHRGGARGGAPAPRFEQRREPSGALVLRTRLLELRFDAALAEAAEPAGLTAAALSVTLLSFPFSTWRPGLGVAGAESGNLHGTIRTLDRVGESLDLRCLQPRDYMTYYAHCEEGLASTDGWVLVDDSIRPRFDTRAGGAGPAGRLKTDAAWDWVGSPPPKNVEALMAGRPVAYYDW
jgi:hypothetical protein